jgi:hypothetical protein
MTAGQQWCQPRTSNILHSTRGAVHIQCTWAAALVPTRGVCVFPHALDATASNRPPWVALVRRMTQGCSCAACPRRHTRAPCSEAWPCPTAPAGCCRHVRRELQPFFLLEANDSTGGLESRRNALLFLASAMPYKFRRSALAVGQWACRCPAGACAMHPWGSWLADHWVVTSACMGRQLASSPCKAAAAWKPSFRGGWQVLKVQQQPIG